MWIKPSHPFSFENNCKITEMKAQINEYIKRTYSFGKPVTIDDIIASFTNKGDSKSLIDFMGRYVFATDAMVTDKNT